MGVAQSESQTARLGVLAYRGAETAREYWRPLSDYLTAAVDGWDFEIVPVTLVSAPGKLSSKQIDFLITNPGHFVALAEKHPLSALATRERLLPGEEAGLLSYGTVIFARRDAGVQTLGELQGKSLAAVSPDAFGGFQLAWFEMKHQNIDAFTDLGPLRFMGFPQDAIVAAVADGGVDAGVVRSGLLESLHAEGRIRIEDFAILNSRSQPGYPFQVTGRLYPEWPFVVASGVSKELREKVSLALLQTQDPGVVRDFGLKDAWSAPLPYAGVRQLVSAYQLREGTSPAPAGWPREVTMAIAFVLGTFLTALALRGRLVPVRSSDAQAPDPSAREPETDDPELLRARERFEGLTPREREILCLICSGQPSKCIASMLGVSQKTVEFHRANLLKKTDAGTTTRLVQMATRLGYDLGFSLGEPRS